MVRSPWSSSLLPRTGRGPARSGRRPSSIAWLRLVAALAVSVVVLAGCSGGSDDGDGADRPSEKPTTTEADRESSGQTTVTTTATTSERPPSTVATTTVATVTSGTSISRYRGTIEGTDATVTFVRSGDAITDLKVSRIRIDCLPMAEGSATTREVTATIPELAVAAGSVDGVAKDEPYSPAITGTFTDDGSFAATVTFSGITGGYSCGGEYPFTATPA